MIEFRIIKTPFGDFGMVAREDRLLSTFLPDRKADLLRTIHTQYPGATENRELLPEFAHQVDEHFGGHPAPFDVEVDLSRRTPFQQRVYKACRDIPAGETASYADLARAVGKPNAARAIGQAMSQNPCPLVIPCHRVVRSDGSLGGFTSSQGIRLKERMLELEACEETDRRAARPAAEAAV